MNNANLGMTIQKVICELFGIFPNRFANSQFEAAYDKDVAAKSLPVIKDIFDNIGKPPMICTTFLPSSNDKEKRNPHNFILEDGSTLSIRTNKGSDKVAPRVVGQCGLGTFNEHFSGIVGRNVVNKNEIKSVVFDYIHLMLPTFVHYLFTSDYTAWITYDKNDLKYEIIESDKILKLDLTRANFTFTRNLEEWNESTTLKYNGKSLAEIQIHKNRTFKFRFSMKSLMELLKEFKYTSETLGITAEKTICDLFGLEYPANFKHRYSAKLQKEITPVVKEAFTNLPVAIKHTGSLPGHRGGESKCSYDFWVEGNEQLSVKTNSGKMVCPPEVGQPSATTCFNYFKNLIDVDYVDGTIFKNMVLNNIEKMIPIYTSHLFDSDFLLWIYKDGKIFQYKIFEKGFASNIKWYKNKFTFTKESIDEWNDSNTVKYDGISIGEFQVHKNRECFKFRFNLDNFVKVVENLTK